MSSTTRPGTGPGSAGPARPAAPGETVGSAVLVHGLWGNPDDWRWVRRLLERRGVHVDTPDLPSHRGTTAGPADDAAVVREALRACPPPVVAVGWSYGGTVITAADGVPGVVGLLYVSAVPRDPGFVEGDEWLDGDPHVTHVALFPDGTHVLDDRWWREEEAAATFPPEVREALRPRRPATRRSVADAQVGAAWHITRATVLMGRTDYFLTDDELARMRSDARLDLRLLDCDHFVPFRDPGAVGDAVLQLLRAGAEAGVARPEPGET